MSIAQLIALSEETVELHSTLINHDPALKSVYGIQAKSCLYRLPGFNPLRCLPPDVMHDILECFMPTHVRELILALHRSKVVPFQTLRQALSKFKYGKTDSANKFPGFPDDWMEKKRRGLGGTAAEKWNFFRLFPFIVGHRVPEENENWKLFKIALRIGEIVLAIKVSDQMIAELANLIEEHHKLWVELYPHTFPAKFHYLVHYPHLIRDFGPLRLLWCMRFESFHQILKTVLARARNFINTTKTASHRVQKSKCLEFADALGLPSLVKINGARKTIMLKNVCPPQAKEGLKRALNASDETFLDVVTSACGGYTIHKGAYFLIHLYCDVLPVFFKTEKIFIYGDTVALYGFLVGTDHFNDHLQAYAVAVADAEDNTVILTKDIVSPQALDEYEIEGVRYLRYRYRPM